jgi:hypothetical protein
MSRAKTWPEAPLSCFLCCTDPNFGRDHPFVRPLRSPSFRPDPRVLRPVARRGSQGWPLSKWFSTHYIFRPLLDCPEHDGKLGRVGAMISSIDVPFSRLSLRTTSSGDDLRRACQGGGPSAPHSLIFGGSERIRTMMQSYASVGEAPRRQAHSVPRLRSHGSLRVTATSDRCRHVAAGSKLFASCRYTYVVKCSG